MVDEILTEAGFIKGETFAEARFPKPPKSPYAVWLDDYEAIGSDDKIYYKHHNYTIELYSEAPERALEENIEAALKRRGLQYDKDSRYWIEEIRLYQTVYTFDFYEKMEAIL